MNAPSRPLSCLQISSISLALTLLAPAASESAVRGSVELTPCPISGTSAEMLCGSYEVFENREAGSGRKISLRIAVLPSRKKKAEPDPIFWIAGGPGDYAIRSAAAYRKSWMDQRRDVVMVDQRGTGGSNALLCDLPGSPSDLQGYMSTYFGKKSVFRRCKRQLKKVANLRRYTTPIAMDDLNEVREAMGYERINLMGSSYGTRAALVYMRRHPETVRSALLRGVAPLAFTSPLFHAEGAQRALDRLFEDCAADPACNGAFPGIADEFETVLGRLEEGPVAVEVRHPDTAEPETVSLPRTWFAEAVRLLMYRVENGRYLPSMIHLAFEGDYEPIAQYVVDRRHAFHLAGDTIGMLLSVTCPGDLARIDRSRIPELTQDTFSGDERVRQQLKICGLWPKARMPAGYGDPVVSDVPVLMWTGSEDPATPPKWGDLAAENLPNSRHVVVPSGHSFNGGCFDKVSKKFVKRASVRGLNDSCLEALGLPPFVLPD